MTALPDVLTDPAVEVVDLRTTLDGEAFERRRTAVEARRNRAVAAAVRDDAGRLLLSRSTDAGGDEGWRLPGTAVGEVTDFAGELRSTVASDLGLALADVTPRWVYRQTAHPADRDVEAGGRGTVSAPLYYVVCEATPEGAPPTPGDLSPADGVTARWFDAPPERLVNPTVVRDRFDD